MRDDERRKLENQLVVMGLSGLNSPDLVVQMANLINNHPGFTNSHAFYLGFINGCPQEKRTEMYEALRPHLKFDVWPLEKYISLLKEHASNVESYYDPVKVGTEPIRFNGQDLQEVGSKDADACLLKLTCYKCTKSAEFYGQTVVTAITVARADGWKRDLAEQKEVCPDCAATPETVSHSHARERARRQRRAKATQSLMN